MQSFKFELLSLRARLAGAVFAVVCSLAVIAAVFVVFASASGELDPLLARIKAAPPASAVVSAAPVK
jgi:hypothetical protein